MAPLPESLLAVWIFAVGTAIGSFLNVLIARIPAGESIVRPRSKCPRCQRPIAWYDNVPLVSWLVLRGRCRGCGAPISARYPAVELLTGLLFLACLLQFGWTWKLVQALTFVSVVVPLVFIDAEHWILPFELTLPGIGLGVLLAVPDGASAVRDAAIGAVVAFVAFRVLELLGFLAFKKEALGAGDKFLFAVVGAFLGWTALLGVVFLSSLQGAVFGLARLGLTGRAGPAPAQDAPGEGSAAPPSPEAEDAPPKVTWEFLKPGLSVAGRVAAFFFSVFLQPVPDEPEPEPGEAEPEWVPGPTNLPFGPWIGLAGLELLLAGRWVAEHVPGLGVKLIFGGGL